MENFRNPDGYTPTETEEFMNEKMINYFRNKLLYIRDNLLQREKETISSSKLESFNESDLSDRATKEEETSLGLKNQQRLQQLSQEIDVALYKIKSGDYGYCEKTGDPISVVRLDAMPTTKYTVEALTILEKENGNRPL